MTQQFFGQQRPCGQCQHFGHQVADGAAVWCLDGGRVHALPESGCAYWKPKNEKSPPPYEGGGRRASNREGKPT